MNKVLKRVSIGLATALGVFCFAGALGSAHADTTANNVQPQQHVTVQRNTAAITHYDGYDNAQLNLIAKKDGVSRNYLNQTIENSHPGTMSAHPLQKLEPANQTAKQQPKQQKPATSQQNYAAKSKQATLPQTGDTNDTLEIAGACIVAALFWLAFNGPVRHKHQDVNEPSHK